MSWKKNCLKNCKLYAITDLKEEDPGIVKKIEGALRGGVDIIQLRSKALSDSVLLRLGKKILKLTQTHKKLFIVNDRVDLMLAMNADGVHLGQDDLPVGIARRLITNSEKIIGCSTHSLKQALEAERQGADYIGFGPIFGTPTKPHYQPIGLNDISGVVSKSKIPVFCIGGIDRNNIEQVLQAGANRIAVVRAVFSTPNPFSAAEDLKGIMEHASVN